MSQDFLRPAIDAPPFDLASAPETIVLTRDRGALRLVWRGGAKGRIDAARLRSACRCAWCTRARIDGTFPAAFDGAAIERLVPIGDYAINICFADGHARGIFPWPFLRALASDDAASSPDATATTTPSAAHHGTSP